MRLSRAGARVLRTPHAGTAADDSPRLEAGCEDLDVGAISEATHVDVQGGVLGRLP